MPLLFKTPEPRNQTNHKRKLKRDGTHPAGGARTDAARERLTEDAGRGVPGN